MIWTTKDGKDMELSEMTASHLANTANMLDRSAIKWDKAEEAAWDFVGSLRGEMAIDEAERQAWHCAGMAQLARQFGAAMRKEISSREVGNEQARVRGVSRPK